MNIDEILRSIYRNTWLESRKKFFWSLVLKKLEAIESVEGKPEGESSIYLDLDIASTIESNFLFSARCLLIKGWDYLPWKVRYKSPMILFNGFLHSHATNFNLEKANEFNNKYEKLIQQEQDTVGLFKELSDEGFLGELIVLSWVARDTERLRNEWVHFSEQSRLRTELYNSDFFFYDLPDNHI